MWGLLLLFFAVAYFAVVGLLLYWVKPYWGKALVLVAAVLIPNADDWYYRHQLADYCKNEAGFKVYQQVSRKEGVAFPMGLHTDTPLKYVPVSFVEWQDRYAITTSRYLRSDRLADGSISNAYEIPQYSAHYEFGRSEQKNGPFTEVKLQIVQRDIGMAVGEFVTLFYYGGWYPGALVGTGGLVAGCGQSGHVVTHENWRNPNSMAYRADNYDELISNVFSKD
jgi:hypothetical protein